MQKLKWWVSNDMSFELKDRVIKALGTYEFDTEVQDLFLDLMRVLDCGVPEIPGFYFVRVKGELTVAKMFYEQSEVTGDLEAVVSLLEIDLDEVDEAELQWLHRIEEPK
jgi:hypothetical protein